MPVVPSTISNTPVIKVYDPNLMGVCLSIGKMFIIPLSELNSRRNLMWCKRHISLQEDSGAKLPR
jgi:hypothetical protein